jgi:hypothetical protein
VVENSGNRIVFHSFTPYGWWGPSCLRYGIAKTKNQIKKESLDMKTAEKSAEEIKVDYGPWNYDRLYDILKV